jgi:hypothetical protein
MSFVVKPVRILNSCLGMLLFVAKACRYNRFLRADSSRRLALLIHFPPGPFEAMYEKGSLEASRYAFIGMISVTLLYII